MNAGGVTENRHLIKNFDLIDNSIQSIVKESALTFI
jgi:hypothetical protein